MIIGSKRTRSIQYLYKALLLHTFFTEYRAREFSVYEFVDWLLTKIAYRKGHTGNPAGRCGPIDVE